MSVRQLRYLGDPVLRTPSEQVTRFDSLLALLVRDLIDTVQEPGRAGLAACQIGSGLAVFAYYVEGQLGYLINPRIVERSGAVDGLEGCLSIPGISAVRRRPALVTVAGLDLDQDERMVTGTGELARCLEHEFDHLRGELYIDRLADEERRRVLREIYAAELTGGGPPAG